MPDVIGAIRDKWLATGGAAGVLGDPVTAEAPTFDGVGRAQEFTGGTVSWHPQLGAFMVIGGIRARWIDVGREQYGYPINDEASTPDGRGRFTHFRAMHLPGTPDSSIYWTPETGGQEIYGAIRDRWAQRGWETSSMGYPVGAEHPRQDGPGREQAFEHGRIVWSPETGALFDPLTFGAPILSGGLAALGGSFSVTVNLDGSVRWKGHAHNSGLDAYDFAISALIRNPVTGRAIALTLPRGRVGHDPDSYDWDETDPPAALIREYLAGYNDAQMESQLRYDSDIGSALEEALGFLIKFAVGDLLAPVGVTVFVGLEIGSLISTGSLVPGARVAEGVLWMAGPGNTLLALAAEGIASAGSRTRELTAEEYDWANTEVFRGALPDRGSIVLTDTIGPGGRAFTFPRFDGKITLNMGPESFDDPRKNPAGSHGQVFVHELVHACQIEHTTMDVALLADALASKVCAATGGDPYAYGPAGPEYTSFNLEQQAQIVSDWYAGGVGPGSNQTRIPRDENSPYFGYITNNVRIGNF